MIELQALAALLAFVEGARKRVFGRAMRVGPRHVVAILGGITLGRVVAATGRSAS